VAGRQPGFDRSHDHLGDLENPVDEPMLGFRGGGLADLQQVPVGGGQHGGDDLVSAQLFS
jgi:hypothetical protein